MRGVARELPATVALDEREGFDGVGALEARVEGGDDSMPVGRLLLAPRDKRATQAAPKGIAHTLKAGMTLVVRRRTSPLVGRLVVNFIVAPGGDIVRDVVNRGLRRRRQPAPSLIHRTRGHKQRACDQESNV